MPVLKLKVSLFVVLLCTAGRLWASDIDVARANAIERHTALASQYQQSNQLAKALQEWRIVNAIDPQSGDVKKRIRNLKADIRATVKILLKHANAAFEDGDEFHAKRIYLAVLALDPEDGVARDSVVLIEGGERLAKLTEKTEIQPSPDPQKSSQPVQIESISVIRSNKSSTDKTSNASVSGPDNAAGDSTTTTLTPAQTLAERHFRQGVELFLSDRPAAIAEFERVLELNPDHVLARRYRSTALKLQQY